MGLSLSCPEAAVVQFTTLSLYNLLSVPLGRGVGPVGPSSGSAGRRRGPGAGVV